MFIHSIINQELSKYLMCVKPEYLGPSSEKGVPSQEDLSLVG